MQLKIIVGDVGDDQTCKEIVGRRRNEAVDIGLLYAVIWQIEFALDSRIAVPVRQRRDKVNASVGLAPSRLLVLDVVVFEKNPDQPFEIVALLAP